MTWSENIQDAIIWGLKEKPWGKAFYSACQTDKHPLIGLKKSIWISEDFGSVQKFGFLIFTSPQTSAEINRYISVIVVGNISLHKHVGMNIHCFGAKTWTRVSQTPLRLVFEQSHVLGGQQQKLWRRWIGRSHRLPEGCVELHPVSALRIKNFTASQSQ